MELTIQQILMFILIIGLIIFMQKCGGFSISSTSKTKSSLVSTEYDTFRAKSTSLPQWSSSTGTRGGNFTAEQIARATYNAEVNPSPVTCPEVLDTLGAVNLPPPTGGDCAAACGLSGYNLIGGKWKYVDANGGAYDNINMVPSISGGGAVRFEIPSDKIHDVVGGSRPAQILKNVIPTSFMTKNEAIGGYKRSRKGGGLAYVSIGGKWHEMRQ